MRGVLERVRGRLRLRYVIASVAVLACGVALLATFLVRGHGGDQDVEQTPDQVATAQRFIDALPTPTGAQRDATSTACDAPARYCVWDAHRTNRQLIQDVREQALARGAQAGSVRCGEDAVVIGDGCQVDVTVDGARFELLANDLGSDPIVAGYQPVPSNPGHVAIVIPNDEDPRNGPVAGDYVRSVVPRDVASELACDPDAGDACARFRATVELGASTSDILGMFADVAHREGFLIRSDGCRQRTSDNARTCLFSAVKFRAVHGGDGVVITALVAQLPSATTSRVILIVGPQANLP